MQLYGIAQIHNSTPKASPVNNTDTIVQINDTPATDSVNILIGNEEIRVDLTPPKED